MSAFATAVAILVEVKSGQLGADVTAQQVKPVLGLPMSHVRVPSSSPNYSLVLIHLPDDALGR